MKKFLKIFTSVVSILTYVLDTLQDYADDGKLNGSNR